MLRAFLVFTTVVTFSGCVTSLPKGKASMAYSDVVSFMESKTKSKSPDSYSKLEYLRSEGGIHILEGSVSPAPIKFTSIGVNRYLFRVNDSQGLPDLDKLSRVHGEESAFIRDFWGEGWANMNSTKDMR